MLLSVSLAKKMKLKTMENMNKSAKVRLSNKVVQYKHQGNITFQLLVRLQMEGIQIKVNGLMKYPLTPVPLASQQLMVSLLEQTSPKGLSFLYTSEMYMFSCLMVHAL